MTENQDKTTDRVRTIINFTLVSKLEPPSCLHSWIYWHFGQVFIPFFWFPGSGLLIAVFACPNCASPCGTIPRPQNDVNTGFSSCLSTQYECQRLERTCPRKANLDKSVNFIWPPLCTIFLILIIPLCLDMLIPRGYPDNWISVILMYENVQRVWISVIFLVSLIAVWCTRRAYYRAWVWLWFGPPFFFSSCAIISEAVLLICG